MSLQEERNDKSERIACQAVRARRAMGATYAIAAQVGWRNARRRLAAGRAV
jgi:hypothetical protein